MNTQNLSDKITGNDYLSAYHSRMKVNNDFFLEVAKELTLRGYSVYHPKDKLISFLKIQGNGKQITFVFNEVPYRWSLEADIDHTKGHGSGITIAERGNYDYPFTIDEIIAEMRPIVKQVMTPEKYLKLFE